MCSDFGRRRFGRAKIPYLILLAVSCFRVSSVSGNVNCSYLSAGPGIGPLERDVGAAVSGAASELVVGALGIKGSDDLYNQWNATFSQYLTDTVGSEIGKTFRLVYLDFDAAFRAVADNCVDFIFSNPSMHLCLELEYEATPVVTLLNFRQGYKLDRFYGTIFTRGNNSEIEKVADMKGKIVEAVSVTGLGACQLQWHELKIQGFDFMNDPAQVRFSYNQQETVKNVIAGHADVGMVRTDMAEGMAAEGLINLEDIKVINVKPDAEFPYPYSTSIAAPEWPLASLRHISTRLKQSIANYMYMIKPEHPAAVKGLYAGWVPPVTYMPLFTMMGDLGFLRNNRCTGNSDTYDAIICPEGTAKIDREDLDTHCDALAAKDPSYECPEGYICLCQPCKPVLPPPVFLPTLEVSDVTVNNQDPAVPEGSNIGAIVGGVVGGIVAVCAAVFAFIFFSRKAGSKTDTADVEVVPELDLDLSSTPCVAKDMAGMVKDMAEKSHGISIKKTTENYEPEDLVIVELLATSGNSRVYKALWRGATVAQKRIELPNNPTTFQKKQSSMAMEAAISASMSHPNVVQTYSCEIVPIKRSFLAKENLRAPVLRSSTAPELASRKAGDRSSSEELNRTNEVVMWEMHIIQELCNKGSVTAALQSGDLPGQTGPRTPPSTLAALHIARDVACGMLHIHSMQIVHADLKSGNVLLVDSRREGGSTLLAKVADFGLSVKMDESQTHVSGVHSGTLTHMSPELLLQGVSAKPADVYAYGIFMFELFTGQRPWKGSKPAQIINSVVQHQKRPVFPPTVPRQIVELATKCWAQEPKHRPAFSDVLRNVTDLIKLEEKSSLLTSSLTVSHSMEPDDNADFSHSGSQVSVKAIQLGMTESTKRPNQNDGLNERGSSSHLKRDVAHAQTHPDTRTNIPPEFSQLPAEEEQDVTESTLGDIPTVMFVMNPMSPVDENEAL